MKTCNCNYWVKVLAVTLTIICWGGTARAAYVNYNIGNGGLETFGITWDATTENALAGGITLTKASGSITMPDTIYSVCTDIGGTLFLGNNYGYSQPQVFAGQAGVKPTWGAGNGGALPGNYMINAGAAIQVAADIFFKHNSVLTTGTLSEKAALQLAVWEALYDTTSGSSTLNLGAGRFIVNSGDQSAIDLATTWLGEVHSAIYAGFLLIPDPAEQWGFPAQEVFYNVTPVPEPTTLIAGALLLLPFGASTVRFLRKNSAGKA